MSTPPIYSPSQAETLFNVQGARNMEEVSLRQYQDACMFQNWNKPYFTGCAGGVIPPLDITRVPVDVQPLKHTYVARPTPCSAPGPIQHPYRRL